MTTPLARAAIASLALAAALSCSDTPIGPEPDPDPEAPSLTIGSASWLTPGEAATLTGTGFDLIESLLVEAQSVDFAVSSPTQLTFTVPTLRECDTDGRPVEVVAAGAGKTAQHTARVGITHTVKMDVGESRVLNSQDLTCTQFAAADEDYVLSALNTVVAPNDTVRDLLTVRTWTEGSLEIATESSWGSPSLNLHANHKPQHSTHTSGGHPYTGNPILFDPAYATAQVGDTVRFVRWSRVFAYGGCDQDPGTLPGDAVRTTVVAALEGQTVVVVDLASPDAAQHLSDFGREWLASAARMADPLLVPSAKELYGQEFEPLAGANGRYFVIVVPGLQSSGGVDDTSGSEAWCALASETLTSLLSDQASNRTEEMARTVAATLVHEYGHLAAKVALGRNQVVNGWMEEAFATSVEGVAYRIATNQPTRAIFNRTDAPATVSGMQASWGRLPNHSPFFDVGQYTRGAILVQYARELHGDAPIGSSAPNLYQAYHAASGPVPEWNDSWGIVHRLAALLGLGGTDLLDQAMLADATDDLIDPEAARAAGLPQIESWYRPDARTIVQSRAFSRSRSELATLSAAPGSYAAVYLIADQDRRGISLTFEERALSEAIVRLTRVR